MGTKTSRQTFGERGLMTAEARNATIQLTSESGLVLCLTGMDYRCGPEPPHRPPYLRCSHTEQDTALHNHQSRCRTAASHGRHAIGLAGF